MLTPFPPFCSTCHQSCSGRDSLHYDLSCDPSRHSHAICRVSPWYLQAPGINLLTLISSFLQQVVLSAALQPGHAQMQMKGTKEQPPENRSSQKKFPDGPSLPRWEFSPRPKSERAQKGSLDCKADDGEEPLWHLLSEQLPSLSPAAFLSELSLWDTYQRLKTLSACVPQLQSDQKQVSLFFHWRS